jgi:multiple sugar transport system permease protein
MPLIYGVLTGLGVVFVLPLVWMARSSFMQIGQIFTMPPVWIPAPFTLDSFREAFAMAPFGSYALNTVTVVAFSCVGTLLSATLAAFGFSRLKWKGRDLIFFIILSGMMLPGAVTLIPQFAAWKTLGFYDTLLPLIVPSFLGGGAFNIFLMRQFFMTIPLELDESAIVDGASDWIVYSRIILPLGRSALIVVALFTFMFHWNDFFNPLIYLSDQAKFTLAIGLQQFQGQYTSAWNVIMAASTIVVAPCVAVFLLGQKYILEGIAMTGLKA